MAPEKPEIAVHIANGDSKHPPHRSTIDLANEDAGPGVGPLYLVSVHQVDIRAETREKVMHFAHIVLPVAVGVEDHVFPDILESRDQRGAIAHVPFMMNHAKVRQLLRKLIENRACLVAAAVINDENFKIAGDFPHFFGRSAHDSLYRVLIVICRKEGAE
jgi:hypothetical protein